jgi:hypothetical protein
MSIAELRERNEASQAHREAEKKQEAAEKRTESSGDKQQ